MPIHFYDTWTRSVREFQPQQPGEVSLYTCGPTVYDYQHIGNYRTFLFEDGLRRVLKLNGLKVNHVMNITDVGHLVSDGDEGEDKMEKGSRRTGQSAWDIAQLYTEAFVQDLGLLGMPMPSTLCKATDHIPEQIAFIERIEKAGFTYTTSDGIYFDTGKQPDYGYLGRLDKEGLQAGRPRGPGREAPRDRLRAVEVLQAAGQAPDGMGFALGPRFSPAGTSSARRWRTSTWRVLRHPLRR